MTFERAKREAVPMMISLAGSSGSGKTYSALLMAAGLAGEGGKVGLIDTEAGRGTMYADDKQISSAMPQGFYYHSPLSEPFTPERYTTQIQEALKSKIDVLVIDSATHEWEGFGGCCDIAESNKLGDLPNWAKAKIRHKRLMNFVTQCPMHTIFCLRAREKSKPVKVRGRNGKLKTEIVEMGLQAIQEKNFMFEMTLSILLSEKAPGQGTITKCPEPLLHLFSKEESIITKNIGQKIRAWALGGDEINVELKNLMRECRYIALQGSVELNIFYRNLSSEDKAFLKNDAGEEFQTEIRALATEADIAKDSDSPQGKILQ